MGAQTLDRHLAGRNQKLKAVAALKGQSLKDYVLGRALGDAPALDRMSEDEAFTALTNFLEPRIEQARRGQLSGKSLDEIRREERKRRCLTQLIPSNDLKVPAEEGRHGIRRYTFEICHPDRSRKTLAKGGKRFGAEPGPQPIRFKFQPDESSAAIQELIGTLTRCLLKYCAGRTEIGYFLKAGRAAT